MSRVEGWLGSDAMFALLSEDQPVTQKFRGSLVVCSMCDEHHKSSEGGEC